MRHRKKPDLGLQLRHGGIFGDLKVPQVEEGHLPVRVPRSAYGGQSQMSGRSLDCIDFIFLKHTLCFAIKDSRNWGCEFLELGPSWLRRGGSLLVHERAGSTPWARRPASLTVMGLRNFTLVPSAWNILLHIFFFLREAFAGRILCPCSLFYPPASLITLIPTC